MVDKLARRGTLDDGDRDALRSLPFTVRTIEAGQYLVREGGIARECSLLLSGFAFRHKLTDDGDRQIVSVQFPGDLVDLEGSLLSVADHNLQALTRAQIAAIDVRDMIALIDGHPRIARALWVDTLVDASIYREWVTNVGRRSARKRIGHIVCEFGRRLELAGIASADGYQFPMTQEQLADAAGLTPVHVNRTLKALEDDALIVRHKRFVQIPDWGRLRHASDFNERYLHLDQLAPFSGGSRNDPGQYRSFAYA